MPIKNLSTDRSQETTDLPNMIASSAFTSLALDSNQPNNPIIDCNDAFFFELTGCSREEDLGRNCWLPIGPSIRIEKIDHIHSVMMHITRIIGKLLDRRKLKSDSRLFLIFYPILQSTGQYLEFSSLESAMHFDNSNMVEDRQQSARQMISALTPRQREVLIQIAQGKLIKQVAYDLNLKQTTVKMHRAAALEALGIKTTAEAIRIVVEAGY